MTSSVVELELPARQAAGAASIALRSLVVGPENRLVAGPIRDLLARGATRFSPLVLVGPSGCGKSHVAQGIVRKRQATTRTAYFTAADFARELVAAIAEERTDSWRAELRKLELVVLEDLDQLREDSPAQLELRNLVDAMRVAGQGTLLVTADREPMAINHLDLGLRDRLAGGLTIRLERPGPEARRLILQLAASARGWELSEDEAATLARREVGAVSQLFGLLLEHVARKSLVEDDASTAGDGAEGGRPSSASRVSMKQILGVTARYLGVSQGDILGHSRKTAYVRARNVAVCLARRLTTLSYASIGHALGGRDHTTIMHAEVRATEQAAADPTLRQAIEELDRILR